MSHHQPYSYGASRELRLLWYVDSASSGLDPATIDEAMRRGRRERAEIFAAAARWMGRVLLGLGRALIRGITTMQSRRAAASLAQQRLGRKVKTHSLPAASPANPETEGVLGEPALAARKAQAISTPLGLAA